MNIKKLFIHFIIVLFIGVIVLSVVTVIKRNNEPKDEFVITNNPQPVVSEGVLQETESVEFETESAESAAEENIPEDDGTQEEASVIETRTLYANSSVNVRSGPGITNSRVGSLAVNDEVIAIGEAENGWQKIQFRDTEAYVSIDYLSENPIETTPAQPEVTPQPEATPQSEVTPQPEVTSEPEATPQPETAPEQEATPQIEETPQPEVTPEPEATPEQEAQPEVTPAA